jgi:hypothetical protein
MYLRRRMGRQDEQRAWIGNYGNTHDVTTMTFT